MSIYITREMLWEEAQDSKRSKPRNLLNRLVRPVVRQWKRNATISELSALSDAQLRDIGIHRGEIPHVARGMSDRDLGLRPLASSARRDRRPQHVVQ